MTIERLTNIRACADFTLRNMPSDTATKKLILDVIEWAEGELAKLQKPVPESEPVADGPQG